MNKLYPAVFYDNYPMDNYSCGMRQMLLSFKNRHNPHYKVYYRNRIRIMCSQLRAIKNAKKENQNI